MTNHHVEQTPTSAAAAHKRAAITRVELRLPTDVAALLYTIAAERGQTISRAVRTFYAIGCPA